MHKLPVLLLLTCMPVLAACPSSDDGDDETNETESESGTETESESGTESESETETTTETESETTSTETETGTETSTETGGACEVSFVDVGGEGQECYIVVTCPAPPDHSVNCGVDGCRCFEANVEVASCPDSLAVCGSPDDLAVLDDCCGWQL